MAEEHVGPRPMAWTKIFSGFKVALDLKKLALAGAGIVVMWLGWWGLSAAFYSLPAKPVWDTDYAAAKTLEEKQIAWPDFKARRASWNLLHELAGWRPLPVEPADVATTLPEYEALRDLYEDYQRYQDDGVRIVSKGKDKGLALQVVRQDPDRLRQIKEYPCTVPADKLDFLKNKEGEAKLFPLRDLVPEIGDHFRLVQGKEIVNIEVTQNAEVLKTYRNEAANIAELQARIKTYGGEKLKIYEAALVALETKLPRGPGLPPREKPGGRLRFSPWTEYRGENPYLLVANSIKATTAEQAAPKAAAPQGRLVAQITEQIPVLLEPLYKVLTPIVYLFAPTADWYIRAYLVLVLLWRWPCGASSAARSPGWRRCKSPATRRFRCVKR